MSSLKWSSIWHWMGVVGVSVLCCLIADVSAYSSQFDTDTGFFDMSLEELLEVDIFVASKKEEPHFKAPGVVAIVPRSEFDLYGDRNLLQLLQRQPSVYIYNSFAYANNHASFRGDLTAHSETHTLILLNGRPVRESAQGHNFPLYLTYPLSVLDSVEIIRGPGSVLYGTNAFTGVINLNTRDVPEEKEFSISSMVGSYSYCDTTVSAAGRSGELGYVAAFRTLDYDGWPYQMTDADGMPGKRNRYEKSHSGTVHLMYKDFTLDIFASEIDLFHIGVWPAWSVPRQKITNKRLFVNLGYSTPLDDRLRLEWNLTYNLQENTLSSPEAIPIANNTSDVLGEITLFANPLDEMNLVFGFLQEHRKSYSPKNRHFQSIRSYSYDPRSAYAQGDYEIDDSLKLIAGTQWHKSPLGDSDLVSRYGVIYTPFEKWGVKLLRGEAFRGPIAMESDLDDPPLKVGNNSLKPETITTYDAQLFFHDSTTYAAVTYFFSTIDDQILFDTSGPVTTYMNGGRQRFEGVEFEAKHFFTPNWHILGSFMHQHSNIDEGLDHTVVPNNMFKFGTGYTWDWGSAALFYSHYGTPPRVESPVTVNPQPNRLNLLSMNFQVDPSRWLDIPKGRASLVFRVENLLNEKTYVPTLAYAGVPNSFPDGPGRTFYGGLTINF